MLNSSLVHYPYEILDVKKEELIEDVEVVGSYRLLNEIEQGDRIFL